MSKIGGSFNNLKFSNDDSLRMGLLYRCTLHILICVWCNICIERIHCIIALIMCCLEFSHSFSKIQFQILKHTFHYCREASAIEKESNVSTRTDIYIYMYIPQSSVHYAMFCIAQSLLPTTTDISCLNEGGYKRVN